MNFKDCLYSLKLNENEFNEKHQIIGWIVETQELPPLNINAMTQVSMQYILKYFVGPLKKNDHCLYWKPYLKG